MFAGGPEDQTKISALCREAEQLEEEALYSSKGHLNAEDTQVRRNYWLSKSTSTGFSIISSLAENREMTMRNEARTVNPRVLCIFQKVC
jgi:hypothetical protein